MYRQIICGTIANIIPPLFYFLIYKCKKKILNNKRHDYSFFWILHITFDLVISSTFKKTRTYFLFVDIPGTLPVTRHERSRWAEGAPPTNLHLPGRRPSQNYGMSYFRFRWEWRQQRGFRSQRYVYVKIKCFLFFFNCIRNVHSLFCV